MFKFDFDLEENEDDNLDLNIPSTEAGPSRPIVPPVSVNSSDQESYEVSLDELLSTLPETILYSPLSLPFLPHPILRRDLHDARFQLASSGIYSDPSLQSPSDPATEADRGTNPVDDEAQYVDAETDLIKGVYEGGLKTWEGGLDILEVLSTIGSSEGGIGDWIRGTSVLEVGCGTALPSSYILHSLLSSSSAGSSPTILHMQDYNLAVLRLVTAPNLLLASLPFLPPTVLHPPIEETDVEDLIPDPQAGTGELHITPELKKAFTSLLAERGVDLKFTYGHWAGLAKSLREDKGNKRAGLVLTSETIYEEASVGDLIDVLKASSLLRAGVDVDSAKAGQKGGSAQDPVVELGDGVERVTLDSWKKNPLRESGESIVLVAAKVLYFGVGGGLQSFLARIEDEKGWWHGVKEWTRGVGRKIVRVGW
ncbi:hypothetical protein BCR39DRAFT_537511 [Naematelia encephala]|uniref:protein-histidine N-methyltransferase n=1 Tax=Naematelia encephala TaxID=71784 RepID=A0A1Y2AYG8_9TREE|nr:hypothetical protein BCR39DRAFT_537511 [Naematelia encephala]